jgi:hypothetical protein
MYKCIGIVKKTGAVCGCKARYEGLYCGRHKAQTGVVKAGFDRVVPDLIDCFVCCGEQIQAVTMPCCGQKLCYSCTIKSHVYADNCVFCRHKLRVGMHVIVEKK